MIGSVIVLCIVGFVLWLLLNAGTGFAATKLEFLEPDAPDSSHGGPGERSRLRVRYGPLSLRAKHVLLAEKSLKIVSGFLVGLYPVDVTQVRVDEYRVHFGWGLIKFIKAWWKREERERLEPKLIIRLVGVRVAIKGNGIDDWEKQAEAMAAGIEGVNHNQANLLTALIDKTTPEEGVPPSHIFRLVDAVINAVDVEVEGFHLSLASANHKDTPEEGTQPEQQDASGIRPAAAAAAAPAASGGIASSSHGVGSEWVLGVKFDRFRLCKKAHPSDETLGVTPRTLKVKSFNMYYDTDGTPVRRRSSFNKPHNQQRASVGSPPPAAPGATAVVRGDDDPELYIEDGASPLTSGVLGGRDGGDGLRQPDDHNSLLMVESIGGTLLFPDLMCVLLGVGRQPGGKGKILAVDFDQMRGVVVELEPFQVFSLLNDALPLLALMGPYAEWCSNARLQWHKEAFARRPGAAAAGGVPATPEELEKYAEALGSLPDGDGEKKYKGDAAELRKLDKNMSLSQIMLTRMRVRNWDATRPERVMLVANLLLNSIDPFQGVPAEDLEGGGAASEPEGAAAGDGGGGAESDEEAPSISSGQSEAPLPSLPTDGPEEDTRLEALLYYAAQESAYAGAENPVLMEIDIRMSAQDVSLLVYHPPCDNNKSAGKSKASSREVDLGQGGDDNDSIFAGSSDGGDDGSLPEMDQLSRQHSGGSVKLGGDDGELATEEALRLRDSLQLPALAASVAINDFKFGFNMLMGSVAAEAATTPCAEGAGEGGPSPLPAGAAAGAGEPEEEGPVQLHTFSGTLFPDALPIRLYKPSRLGQGADLRVESFGDNDEVGDGVAGMSLSFVLGGTRVTDFGALEDGGVLPTLIGGPAAVSAAGDGDDSHAAGGTTKATLALFVGGRLEAGLDFQSCTVVALPGRIMAIIDVVLACLMGPPAAREAQELNALEEEVEAEEAEEATGGVGTTEVVDARWKAIDKVRGAYLFLGRLDARFSVRVDAFSLILPQDSRDARTNVVMAQCSALALDMKSGSAFEALAVSVCDFSVAPCVQRPEASDAAIVSCGRLHETGVAIALRGPLPELLEVIHRGFPLKDLDLFPIPERRIILPVKMKIKYSTYVALTAGDTLEASTATLVTDMVQRNSESDLAAMHTADVEKQELAVTALSGGEEDQAGGGPTSAAAETDGNTTDSATASEVQSGWHVKMEVQLHVSSGLYVKVTDLDIAVLQGIATSLIASLGVGEAAPPAAGGAPPAAASGQSAAGKSLTFALDKAQRRMVASLRQAFRLADVNGDGNLDRAEVEALLRLNLQGQNLDPTQTEAEVLQFIALLDADGTETLDIDEFTSTMMRLMTDGPDEVTLARARRQALTKAFDEADTDGSGSLDAGEILELLKSSDPLRTHSELDRQVSGYIEAVDVDNDGQLDLEEFIELVQSMREGGVHEGPLEPKAEEFRSWEVIKPMLEGYKTLPELLAARPPDYSPPGFWELFEAETHATKSGSAGQLAEAVQAKMVKTFENYGFAGDAWSFLVAPAWYPGVVRVGSLAVAGGEAGGGGGGGRSKAVGPQQIPAPVRPGALVYAQEHASSSRRASPPPGALSGMRIQRLPEELAAPPATPPAVDPLLLSTPPPAEKYATGVRLPAPGGTGRRRSMRGGASSASPPGVRMEIDRPCTLLVCFHDEHASAGAGAGAKSGVGGEGQPRLTGARSTSSTSSGGSRLDVPKWADEMGLRRTGMHIDTVLPGDGDSASTTAHVYRVFSTPIAAGAVELGPGLPGSLPYFVLLYGGNHLTRRTSRTPHGRLAVQRPVRAVTDSGRGGRRVLRSLFRKHNLALGGSGSGGGRGGSSINSLSRQSRGSSAGAVVSSLDRGISGESFEMTPTTAVEGLGPAAPPERRTSIVSIADSVGPAATAAVVNGNPSWQLTPEYSLGGATRGVTSIGAKADKNAKMAASTAMKIAAISSAGTTAANAASGAGGGAGGIEVAKKPRVRLKVTLLCEHGIFVQMDDIHRLENTPSDDSAAPTFELALGVPWQDRGGGGGGGSGTKNAKSPSPSPGSVPSAAAAEASPPSTEALAATLDFEHVASSEILGDEDSMCMDAAFGIEGKYFNPRVHQSEHFIEPWSMSIQMSDPRGESTPRGQMIADQHFVLNVTTGLTSLACSIMESRDYAKTRYSTTSVYTELRDGNDGDDGTRLLTIENHLGVPVRVTLEDDASSSGAAAREKGRPFGLKKAGRPAAAPEAPADATSGNFCRIASTLYDQQEGGGEDGPPSDRVSVGELTVPNAKMALPTATVTIKAKGFEPVTGVPLDLLGRGTHVYRMTRSGRSGEDKGSKKWRYEGLVVKFVARAARTASVLDLAMQLQTNVALKNDLPRPLRVALSPENENHPNTLVPVDAEVCLPLPLLRGKVLRLWKSPRTLVGGEALKRALQADADRQAGGKRGSGAVGLGSSTKSADRYGSGGWDGAASEAAAVGVGDEVSVEISPNTFDRNKRVVERHSQGMLVNGVSVERADLAPTPGLVMHGSGDDAPALWRLYTRAPYVVQNGLACDVVVWASQPLAEEGNATLDTVLESPGPASSGGGGLSASAGRSLKGRLSLKKLGLSPKRDSDGSARPRSSASSGSKFRFTPKSWKKGSGGAPFREGGGDGSGSGGSGGAEEVSKLDSDSDDDEDDEDDEVTTDDTDTDLEQHDEEEMEMEEQELDRLSAIGAASGGGGGGGVVVAGAGAGGPPNNGRVMWVLKSGEEAKLEGMDPTRHLRLRVGFAPADGSSSCSDFCKSYIIEAKRHTNRTLLNRMKSKEAVFSHGARGSGGARRPEFKFGAVWEHTPGNRHIHLYSKVWVLNKTGVSLAYRASIPTKEDDRKEKVFVRRPYNASYRTDGDTMLFSRYMTGAKRCKSFGGGDKTGGGGATASEIGGEAGFPLMLTCRANTLQTMPYAMADSAVGAALLLSETRSSKSEQPLPCLTVPAADDADADADAGGGGGAESSSWPLYCDYPPARVRLPEEVVSERRRRVHLLTLRSDTGSVTFTPSRDCRVYIGLDKRLLAADPGPPKWLALQGFERREGLDVSVTDVQPADLAPQGFGLYSRFCRGLSVVPLGQNLDHDGDGVSERRGGPAAMYFVVVVRVPESEAVGEVDIGPVAMHRSVGKIFDMREHHRWRMKPNFKPGDPCYTDRPSSENTVTGLPEKLRGLKLMHIATSQGDKKVKANNMASFQTLQRSRVLVCFDSRAPKPPSWLAARGFAFQDDLHLSIDPAGTGTNGYKVYAKNFIEGAEVKLGGNKASGAKRMYFVLVHATGDQQGRISAPPVLPTPMPLAPPSPANAAAANPDPFGDSGGVVAVPSPAAAAAAGARTSGRLSGTTRKGGVFVESHDDQVFRFWDDKVSGKLVQTPLDLDRQGRGWCQPFATDAVKTSGQAKSPAGVFGVTVEALSGAFLKTRVVTVWPRFVIRNNLGRKVGVLSTVEPPPKRGKDHGQSIARVTEEEKEDLKNVQRASRKKTQALPDGASVILYDFTDPDDYDFDEDEDAQDASARFGSGGGGGGGGSDNPKPTRKQLQLWKRTSKKGKEGKLPCVRLLSGVHKNGGPGRKGSSRSCEGSALGEGGDVDEQWVELPTVPVLLESLGKDTYVWMEGGHHQEDVLVRVSCRMLSNGATIHVVLSNETPSPPLRIENRSSTQTLCYRLGGDAEDNVRLLEPMRWNSLHWVNDDKRIVEAAVYADHHQGRGHRASRSIRKRKDKVKGALKTSSRRGPVDDDVDDDDDDAGGRMGDAEKHAVSFSSFRWGSRGKFGDSPRREYRTEDVGRLKDLVGAKRKGGGGETVRLKVECLRPPDSVVTTVLAFSDTPDGVYATSALAVKGGSGEKGSDARDDKALENGGAAVETKFARIWTGLHFDAKFAGLVLNIIDSTPSGPSELAAFTVDNFELGKPSGTPGVTVSVWHFQLDDMRADSPHPIILAPQCTGFNSHLTKVHYNGLSGSPAFRVEVERDVEVSLTHHMWVIRSIEMCLGKVHCAVHVDFWIDVQDVVFASLNWTNSSPAEARARAIADTQGVVGNLLQAPAADATVDRIYIGEYFQEEIEVAVDFHLGTKVAALLSSKPPADGDEEKDEGGFGASLAMMPLGAVGGVVWGLLSSFGAGIANASPTFNFDAYELEHYYGSKTQAVTLVVMSFVKQGVVQAYKVLGHIDILGDPLSLGMNISSGVIGFVTKTGAGHIGEGSKDLVKGVVGGTASSASKMTDALDNFVREAGCMDAEAPSGMESTKAPEHLGQGLTQGMMYFGHTVKDGITGVVMKPVRGARKNGAAGFVKGVGQGVVGLVAAPVSAALGATSKITAGIDATTRLLDDEPMGRRREPRHPLGLGERDDRDRLKQELKKARKKRRDSAADADLEDVGSDGGGGDGDDVVVPIDTKAEAGGMGLLLVPLTPAEMRTNYPEEYLERCLADMASRAGAVAIADKLEADLARFKENLAKKSDEETAALTTVIENEDGVGGGAEESKGEEVGGDESEEASPVVEAD